MVRILSSPAPDEHFFARVGSNPHGRVVDRKTERGLGRNVERGWRQSVGRPFRLVRGRVLSLWDRVFRWLASPREGLPLAAGPVPDARAAVATLEPPGVSTDDAGEKAVERWWVPDGAELLEPPPVDRPELSSEALALENVLLSQFDGHDLSLPPLPHVPELVLRRLRDPACKFARVADDIAEDQVIAVAVLRMANSVLYRGRVKVTALLPAVTRLGVGALRTLMLQQSLRAATLHIKSLDERLARIVWRRSLASACVMSELSAFAGIDREEAFLAGLLHDVGNIIVLRSTAGQEAVLRHKLDIEAFEYLCLETHQEFGELIADAWDLPLSLKDLIADHHEFPAADDPLRGKRLLLQLTDMINAMLGYAPEASYNLLESRVVTALGVGAREDFVAALAALPARIEEASVIA